MSSSNSDWLDQELDRLAQGAVPDRQPPDPDLAETAREINQLYANEQSHLPDDDFVQRLGETLMPVASNASGIPLAHTKSASGTFWSDHGISLPKPRSRPRMTFVTSFLSVAALLLVLAGSAYFALRSNPSPEAPTQAAAYTLATPVATETQPTGIEWQLPAADGEHLNYGGMAVANGTVYRLLGTTKFIGVEAVNAEDGAARWTQSADWSAGGMAADESGVYFLSELDSNGRSQLVALNPSDGTPLWRVSLDETVLAFRLQDGVIYLWDNADTMTAIDAKTGAVQWQSESLKPAGADANVVQAFMFDSKPVVAGDLVLMISTNGTLAAINRDDGKIAWTRGGFSAANTRFAAVDGTLVMLTENDYKTYESMPLRAIGIDLADGSTIWEDGVFGSLNQPVVSTVNSTSSIAIIANGISDSTSNANDAPSPGADSPGLATPGSWQPASQSPEKSVGTMALSLDPKTGAVKWASIANQDGYASIAPRMPNGGFLMAIGNDGTLAVLNPISGALAELPTELGQPALGAAIGSQEGVFVTLQDGTLVSLSTDHALSIRG